MNLMESMDWNGNMDELLGFSRGNIYVPWLSTMDWTFGVLQDSHCPGQDALTTEVKLRNEEAQWGLFGGGFSSHGGSTSHPGCFKTQMIIHGWRVDDLGCPHWIRYPRSFGLGQSQAHWRDADPTRRSPCPTVATSPIAMWGASGSDACEFQHVFNNTLLI